MKEKVIIIGGGPAGLSAAIYLARAKLSPLVFAGSPPGGQLTLTSHVENFPGWESILGQELIEKIRHQAEKFGAKIINQNITQVDLNRSEKKVYFSGLNEGSSGSSLNRNLVTASAIIIATGARALWLQVPGEERLRGKGVSACATCDGFFFKDKVVAIVGGGDTAMEEALTLTKFAKKVYIIHRRDSFRASKIMQERVLHHPKVEVIWRAMVKEVIGKDKVEGVRLESTGPSSNAINQPQPDLGDHQLKIDGLFVAIGHKPDTEIFKEKTAMDEKGYIITSQRLALELLRQKDNSDLDWKKLIDKFDFNYQMTTSVPGVFAAGDCVDIYYRQAATAAGMGVAAAIEVERWLEKEEK